MVWTINILSVNDFSALNLYFMLITGRHHDINSVKGVSGSLFWFKQRMCISKSLADIMSV